MHSPIIYLIRKNNKNEKDYKGHLPNGMILEFGSSNRGSIPCSAVKFIL